MGKRRSADKDVNNRNVLVLRGVQGSAQFDQVSWKDIVVGDIVRVVKGHEFPADLIMMCSSTEGGLGYIETANLDGETNLKIKQAVPALKGENTPTALAALAGHCRYEHPNNSLYTFSGTLSVNGVQLPVNNENILLRGATLRNTAWVCGFVVYTGHESKIVQNSRQAPSKRSNMEVLVNRTLVLVLGLEALLCTVSTVANSQWVGTQQGAWYLPSVQTQTRGDTALGFLTFFILFNNFVPISLYVTIEVVKVCQALMMVNDLSMYHADTDTPAAAARLWRLKEGCTRSCSLRPLLRTQRSSKLRCSHHLPALITTPLHRSLPRPQQRMIDRTTW